MKKFKHEKADDNIEHSMANGQNPNQHWTQAFFHMNNTSRSSCNYVRIIAVESECRQRKFKVSNVELKIFWSNLLQLCEIIRNYERIVCNAIHLLTVWHKCRWTINWLSHLSLIAVVCDFVGSLLWPETIDIFFM